MAFDNVLSNNKILEAGLEIANLRNAVINNNIANAEVPGFKKSVVEFEKILNYELNKDENKDKDISKIDLSNIRPYIKKVNTEYNYRIDESNVDIEVEMAELYKNSIRYETMTDSIINNYKRINMVLNARS